MRHRIVFQLIILLLLFFLATTACNYPGARSTSNALSAQELRQTLQASTATTSGEPSASLTGTPVGGLLPSPTPITLPYAGESFQYYTHPGDTLEALAGRFGVDINQITAHQVIQGTGLLKSGQLMVIPNSLPDVTFTSPALPDGEVVNSPSSVGFDLSAYISQAGGFLDTYQENLTVNGKTESLSGLDIILRLSTESSINPRLLLAFLEFRAGWVFGQPVDEDAIDYPIGFHVSGQKGLYRELLMCATHLNLAYYGWREGTFSEMKFADGKVRRVYPTLNAGSVALQNLLAKLYFLDDLDQALYAPQGFLELYTSMFGDAWERQTASGAIFPENIALPELQLPFTPSQRWSLTGGPHVSWKTGSPRGAVDLAPVTGEAECVVSRAWVTSPIAGMVVRSLRNVVALDLDGDGDERTGWVIIFMHVADKDRVAAGVSLKLDDQIGHPSCEGGLSTGAHVHVARKYNGEWLSVSNALPFVMSGWVVFMDDKNYQGGLRKGDQVVVASPVGPSTSIIVR